jgi:hypothetical protein
MINVGDKVLCIADNFHPRSILLIPNRPVKDQEYIVREIIEVRDEVGLLLEEISNPLLVNDNDGSLYEPNFNINRFKKLKGNDYRKENSIKATRVPTISRILGFTN